MRANKKGAMGFSHLHTSMLFYTTDWLFDARKLAFAFIVLPRRWLTSVVSALLGCRGRSDLSVPAPFSVRWGASSIEGSDMPACTVERAVWVKVAIRVYVSVQSCLAIPTCAAVAQPCFAGGRLRAQSGYNRGHGGCVYAA